MDDNDPLLATNKSPRWKYYTYGLVVATIVLANVPAMILAGVRSMFSAATRAWMETAFQSAWFVIPISVVVGALGLAVLGSMLIWRTRPAIHWVFYLLYVAANAAYLACLAMRSTWWHSVVAAGVVMFYMAVAIVVVVVMRWVTKMRTFSKIIDRYFKLCLVVVTVITVLTYFQFFLAGSIALMEKLAMPIFLSISVFMLYVLLIMRTAIRHVKRGEVLESAFYIVALLFSGELGIFSIAISIGQINWSDVLKFIPTTTAGKSQEVARSGDDD